MEKRPNLLPSLKNGVKSNINLGVLTNDVICLEASQTGKKRVQKVGIHCLTSFMYVPFAKCYGLVTLKKVSSFRGWGTDHFMFRLTGAD